MAANQPQTPSTLDDLNALVGVELGPSAWSSMSQERVASFGAVTGDLQWIHVDAPRAEASPLGSTVVHGLFTLSLGPALLADLISFEHFSASLNYGYEKVRFPAPLPTDSRVRLRAKILSVQEGAKGLLLHHEQVFEREDHDRPVCVAVSVAHLVPGPPPT
ncbi:MaoC family dehydratase [Nocardioides sp.]|uniref:MaoC family dehydratase n=1 Tax=Nocardioides sp. TaxID=35761 RepID=UPI003D0D611E